MKKVFAYFLGFALLTGCGPEPTSPPDPPTDPPSLATTTATLPFAQVSAGANHTCGLTTGGQVYCWGVNSTGQLGDGTTEKRARPTLVAGGLVFRQVSAGQGHTCALTTANRAYCWGYNGLGQLGDGTEIGIRHAPVPVAGGRAFRQISAGDIRTCAVTPSTTGKIYCWGSGILGNGTGSSTRTTPQLVSGTRTYRQVAVGGAHTCAVTTTYKAFCWGYNNSGQLGNGSAASFSLTPVAVAGTLQFRQVSAGGSHTCAVTTSNKAYCWGYGRYGQIGDGKTYLRFTPRAVVGGLSFGRISAGGSHTCGETTSDKAYCWGYNGVGQLGDGTLTTPRLTPTAVQGGLLFKQVAAGGSHTCGVDSGSRAWCWGGNGAGQLGNGTFGDPHPSPSMVQF
jgi:alpha-tubulin suppressor-like RCC1 family protein